MNKRLEVEDSITMIQEKLQNIVSLMELTAYGVDNEEISMKKVSKALLGISDLTMYIYEELGDILEKVSELQIK